MWKRSENKIHTPFVTITCATVKDAEKAIHQLEMSFIAGQQSVIRAIAELSNTPMPVDPLQGGPENDETLP